MKLLICLALCLSLLVNARVQTCAQPPPESSATPPEVLKLLAGVPVFAVANKEGAPLVAEVPDPNNQSRKLSVSAFFMSHDDALKFLAKLEQKNPEMGKAVKVTPISLMHAHELETTHRDGAKGIVFEFISPQHHLDAAIAVLKQNGQDVKTFNEIPLFYLAEQGTNLVISVTLGSTTMAPLFFSKADQETLLDGLRKKDPQMAARVIVKVTSLQQLLGILTKEKSAGVGTITLMPDSASIKYVREMQK